MGGVVNYPELEELKESYKNGKVEADGILTLSQLDEVAGGHKLNNSAAKARIAISKKRNVRKPTNYITLSKIENNEQLQVKYEDNNIDSKESYGRCEVAENSFNIERLCSVTEIETQQQNLFVFETAAKKGAEKVDEPSEKLVAGFTIQNREKSEEVKETAEAEDNTKPDDVEKEAYLEENQKDMIDKIEENVATVEPKEHTKNIVEFTDKISDVVIDAQEEKRNEETSVDREITYIENDDNTKIEIEKEKPVIEEAADKMESNIKYNVIYKKTSLEPEESEGESEEEKPVIAHEHNVEVTDYTKASPHLSAEPLLTQQLPKKPLPPKRPKSNSTPNSETSHIISATQQLPKKPLPPKPYRAEISRQQFEEILSAKIIADDKFGELNLLVTGLHELVKSPILLKVLYDVIKKLNNIYFLDEKPNCCGKAYLNVCITINQNLEDRMKIYTLIHEAFHCKDYGASGCISKSFAPNMLKDIEDIVRNVNGTYILTESGKDFLQSINDILSKPYSNDLDVFDILDSIENTICCLFASVGLIDVIKSIFPNNLHISDANYPCFHSEFVANFGHALCIATSGYPVFLNFLSKAFPSTTAIFEEKILGKKGIIEEVILSGHDLAS